MQRQSLGSPSRERLEISTNNDDPKRYESSSSSFFNDDEVKPEKPHKSHSQPEKFIHLIPILVLFCFLVLYLSSHDPSPQDLALFHGINYKQPEQNKEIMKDIERVENNKKELKRSKAFVIRSLSNFQEEIFIQRDSPKALSSHRKLGDF